MKRLWRLFLERFFGKRCDWGLWTAEPCRKPGRFMGLKFNDTLDRFAFYCEEHMALRDKEDR